jgi:hypothetical protein
MRIAARIAQDQSVELAGLKTQLLRREFVFAGRAEIDGQFDRRLPRQIARRERRRRLCRAGRPRRARSERV